MVCMGQGHFMVCDRDSPWYIRIGIVHGHDMGQGGLCSGVGEDYSLGQECLWSVGGDSIVFGKQPEMWCWPVKCMARGRESLCSETE